MFKRMGWIGLLGFVLGVSAVAKKPLPDYLGTFKKLDTQIRAISESDAACTNYTEWAEQAIECKNRLRLRKEINPWLRDLSTVSSNNWKMLHAVAVGYAVNGRDKEKNGHWIMLKLMDRAYRRAVEIGGSEQELGGLIEDYVDMLLLDREDDDSYLLGIKTCSLSKDDDFSPKMVKGKKRGDLVFFDCPVSYEAAVSDGELVRWLIEKSMPASYEGKRWLSKRGMAGFALYLVNELSYFSYRMDSAPQKKLHALKDNEVFLRDKAGEDSVFTLPKDYRYIAQYKKLAAEGDHRAMRSLGLIYYSRKQLEKAAHFFELAGETNSVRSIRANQGELQSCSAQPSGKPASIDYAFRNGTEVTVEIFQIPTETNVLARLRAGTLSKEKIDFIVGESSDFSSPKVWEKLLGDENRVATIVLPLTPLPDHGDGMQRIEFPTLKEGHYLVRATLKDGNVSRMMLDLYDTLVFVGKTEGDFEYEITPFFIFCDAATGAPKADHLFYLYSLFSMENSDRAEVKPYYFAIRQNGITDLDGIYLFNTVRSLGYYDTHLLFGRDAQNLVIYRSPESIHGSYFSKQRNIFVGTDRPIYRPGDIGFFKLAFPENERESAIISFDPPRGKSSIPFKVGEALTNELTVVPDRFGGADGCFKIPQDAALGCWALRSSTEDRTGLTRFKVEEYRAPTFTVKAQLLPSKKLEVVADYAYGQPVAGGKVHVSGYFNPTYSGAWYPKASHDFLLGRGYTWHGGQFGERAKFSDPDLKDIDLNFTGVLDADGRLELDSTQLKTSKAFDVPGYFRVTATVTDAAQERQEEGFMLPTAASYPKICCRLDKSFFNPTETPVCHIVTGEKMELIDLELAQVVGTNVVVIRRFSDVKGSVELSNLKPGLYEVRANAQKKYSKPFRFAVLGGKSEGLSPDQPIRLVREKGCYESGETARILIQTDRPGRYVYFFHRVMKHDSFSVPSVYYLDSTEKVVDVRISECEAGYLSCAAMVVKDGKARFAGCSIPVIDSSFPVGSVEVKPEKTTYRPGELVKVELYAHDMKNKGYPSSIAVSVYNQSLDLLTEDTPADIRSVLFSYWNPGVWGSVQLNSNWSQYPNYSLTPKWVMGREPPKGSCGVLGSRFFVSYGVGGCASEVEDDTSCFFGEAPGSTGLGSAVYERSTLQPVPQIRKDFRDLAYWNATVETDAQGRANIEFPMPDQLTKWKIRAWAIHTNFAGSGTASVRCEKDFVLQLNLPRFMVVGDELEISASLRNHTTNAISATAICSIKGAGLQFDSPASISVESIKPHTEQMLYWKVAATAPNDATLTVSAQGKRDADGMEKIVPIRPHTMLKRGGNGGVLAGDKKEETIQINLPQAIDPSSVELTLNCSANMQDTLANALPYLAEYPHGCTEQTLNRFLPALVVLQTLDKLKLALKPAAIKLPEGREAVLDVKKIEEMAQKGINSLESAKGYTGWSWELGGNRTDPLTTAWVLRGLHIATQNPQLNINRRKIASGLDDLLDRMRELPLMDLKEIQNSDAFTAVVCAELGVKTYSDELSWRVKKGNVVSQCSMYLLANANALSLYGKVLLAYAFELQGKSEQRDQLLKFIEQYLENDPALGTYWLRTKDAQWWHWYNDSIELHAWYLKLLNRMEPSSAKTAGVARYLLQNRIYGDHWKATRDTAICIEALCEFMKNNPPNPHEKTVKIMLNGQAIPSNPQGFYRFTHLKPGMNELHLQSIKPLFFDATWHYNTHEQNIAAESCELVTILRSYHRIDAKDEAISIPLSTDEKINVGETIEVHLTVQSSQDLEYLLLEDFRPAGFECLKKESGYKSGSYMELHDERISCYIQYLPKGTKEITYRIRAEHAGTMSALPATVELMYAPRQAANSIENKLHVDR